MTQPLANEVSVRELVSLFGGELRGAAGARIRRLAPLATAQPGDLSFLAAPRLRPVAAHTRASVVVVSAELADALPEDVARMVVADPYAHFARIARWYASQIEAAPAGEPVHPAATIAPGAALGAGVRVGALAVIEEGAAIGDGAVIGAHCYVGQGARIGPLTRLHPRVTVLQGCSLGARCIVHSGSVIGADGFGFAREQGRWAKIPQLGSVVIGDDVEIGANCTIDRGALEDTVIGDGCKLDNQIQIAHNVRIGEHSALAGCVGVAGSAVIGRRCMIGGGAGILGHLEICDDVVISAMSLVTRSIRAPGFYTGVFPLMPNAQWERSAATLRRLPELRARLRAAGRARDGSGSDSKD